MGRRLTLFFALAVMFVGGLFIVISFSTLNFADVVIGIVITSAGFVFLGRGSGRSREDNAVAFDLIAVAITGVFFLILIVAALSGVLANAQGPLNVAQFLLIMEVGGIAMAIISGVFRLSTSVSKSAFGTQMLFITANFAAFFVLNLIVPPTTYRILGIPLSAFGGSSNFVTIIIAVPETTVFQIWLAPWLSNLSRTGALGGSFLAALIATAYHLFVLGTNPAALGIVFGAFFVMDFTAIKSRLASVPLTNHLLNNFLSVAIGI